MNVFAKGLNSGDIELYKAISDIATRLVLHRIYSRPYKVDKMRTLIYHPQLHTQ